MRKPCVHHWILETPEGLITIGRCKKCRKKQEFPTHLKWEAYPKAINSDPRRRRTNVGETSA